MGPLVRDSGHDLFVRLHDLYVAVDTPLQLALLCQRRRRFAKRMEQLVG